MKVKTKRLILDLDPAFQRRLKATAALKGVSMRGVLPGRHRSGVGTG